MPCLSIFTQFCSYCSLVLLLKMFCFIQADVKMCISTHSIYLANNSVAGERIRIPNARARRTDPGNVYVTWKSVRESVTYSVPLITLRQVRCSQLHWADVLKIVERPTCYYKWESEYYCATCDWEFISATPYESTADTYLQSLQFRIIHLYFPCKYNLHLWNIVGDNKCEFCNDVDILSHYFAECDSTVQFWKFLKRWFIRSFQFVINFTSLDVLLGIQNYDNSNDVIILKFVILFTKYYIQDSRFISLNVHKAAGPLYNYNILQPKNVLDLCTES